MSSLFCSDMELSAICSKIASVAPVTDQKALIDLAIAKHYAHLCALKAIRNKMSWISHLPEEIFTKIMLIVVRPNPDTDYHAISWKLHVQYTSVCTDWRGKLLGSPAFWARIPLFPCKYLEKMVARSDKVPVVVRLNLELYAGDELAKAALAKVLTTLKDRLVEFHFKSHARDSFIGPQLWASLPKGEASLLQSLKLSLSGGGPYMPKIPTSILAFARPNLQHLALGSCQIDWAALKSAKGSRVGIQNLISLHLHRIDPPPPRDILLSILRSSPKLEALHMEKVIPKDFDTCHQDSNTLARKPSASPIRFRSLTVFHLADYQSLCAELFALLRVPPSVLFAFIALEPFGFCPHHQQSFSVAFKAMVPKLLKQYKASIGHPDTRGSSMLRLKGHACGEEACHEASGTLQKYKDGEGFVDTLRLQGSVSGFLPMLRTFCAPELDFVDLSWTDGRSSRSDTEPIVVDVDPELLPTSKDWRGFFRRHPQLGSIHLRLTHGFPIRPFVSALERYVVDEPADSPVLWLRILHFEGVKFGERDFTLLADYVTLVEEFGAPLETLVFEDCVGLDEDKMAELRLDAEDTDVIWDGFDDESLDDWESDDE